VGKTPKDAMEEIFSQDSIFQSWLDFEAALARAEASMGIVPEEAANEITNKASIEFFDKAKFEETRQRVWLPTVAFIQTFQAACDGSAGQYIHLGATSQDIVDTGQMLCLKKAYGVVLHSLREIESGLIELADKHSDTLMIGRTHDVQALPITFGYKAAVWLREVRRHIERLKWCRDRLFVLQLSGAVGTMASFGEAGPSIQSLVAEELGLGLPEISWHTSRDRLVEWTNLLSMISGTLAKIAHNVYHMMSTEVNEVREPWRKGIVGSSTMPHKINPVIAECMLSLAKKVRYNAALVTEFMVVDYERNLNFLLGEMETIKESCLIVGELLTHSENMAHNLTVYPERMKANANLLKGVVLSEAVMLALGKSIGKQSAHEVVYEDAMKSFEESISFKQVLLNDNRVGEHLTGSQIDRLLDPSNYVGLAPQMAKEMVALTLKEREADNS
jgi:adenylosuccinate lyase